MTDHAAAERVRVFVDLLASAESVQRHIEGPLVIVDPFGGGAATLVALDAAGAGEPVDLPPSSSLAVLAGAAARAGARVLVADLVNARPAASLLARMLQPGHAVTFAAVAADGVYVAGRLVLTLLEELAVPAVLDDGAGIAVAIASAATAPRAGLLMSARGRAYDEAVPAGVTAAAQIDSVGVVAAIEQRGTGLVAVATRQSAAAG